MNRDVAHGRAAKFRFQAASYGDFSVYQGDR
jgi:hypothetical protein